MLDRCISVFRKTHFKPHAEQFHLRCQNIFSYTVNFLKQCPTLMKPIDNIHWMTSQSIHTCNQPTLRGGQTATYARHSDDHSFLLCSVVTQDLTLITYLIRFNIMLGGRLKLMRRAVQDIVPSHGRENLSDM